MEMERDIMGGCQRSKEANDIDAPSDNGPTANTRLQRQAERQQQAMGIDQLCEEQPTPNPTSNRRERNGQGIEIEKGLQPRPESAGQLERGFEGLCNTGDAADADSNGRQRGNCKHEVNASQGGVDAQRDAFEVGEYDTNPDGTNNQARTQRKVLGQPNREKTNGFGNVECRTQWQNFPTQPPVCIGDDGLSAKLDGITFSKWRNESIKAAGNAVVPQVVFQIFKAIEQMTNQQKR
jgi:hypothetical protein